MRSTALPIYNPECNLCKLHQTADEVCQSGFGPKKTDVMVVSKMPNSGTYQTMIESELVGAGLDLSRVFFTAATKCRTFDQDASTADVKKCRPYLEAEIQLHSPKWILAFGNEALLATTGNSGITKHRGRVIDKGDYRVVGTVAPGSVTRNPGQKQGWEADIQFFVSQVLGRAHGIADPKILVVNTKDKLNALIKILKTVDLISYDVETSSDRRGSSEFDPNAAIVSLSGTTITVVDGEEKWFTFAIPLFHPESVWRNCWTKVLKKLSPVWSLIPKQVAHNGKFDARWCRYFGLDAKVTFDTMLAAHLLDENRVKRLKDLCRIFLGVSDWSISTSDLLTTPIRKVLKYNALDTYYTLHLYKILREQLIEQPRLLRIFTQILIPASEAYIEAEQNGVWLDKQKLASANKIAQDMRSSIDAQLMSYVPDKDKWPTNAKGKTVEANFNASNFARWFLFEERGLPVIMRGKDKANGEPGNPSMKEEVMLELKKSDDPVIDLMLERTKWEKYCNSFLEPYQELMDDNGRIHTSFKLFGTVTGRTSSGKEDTEKITARRGKLRGVNLQQVPRDAFIRGLFGAPPGYSFIEADFSQVELRVVAFLSRDRTMVGIYQRGEDIHTATASWVLGVPLSKVSKDDRKKAKAVNFGFVYGMGWRKFIQTAWLKYGVVFDEYEAQAVRRTFFERFPGLPSWHARQRRIVREFGRVQSPIGRIRHLPDIYSADQGVQAEAERQAINSPVQSFASDMCLLSMIIIRKRFALEGIDAKILGTVHDAINFEILDADVPRALPIIKDTMENLPLKKKFGIEIDLPIISDLKIGSHWGDARELSPEEVYDFRWAA